MSANREPCTVCGAPLDPDQEWCLECGTGRTLLEPPPDWRIPVLVVGTIILVAIAGFIVALVELGGGDPVRRALSPSPPKAAAHTASTTPHPTGWPAGLDGWTVIVASSPSRAAATAAADRLIVGGLTGGVGVLDAAQHPAMARSADLWHVFDGRYPTRAAAQTRETALRHQGQGGAAVVEVAPPGGI